jgi:hypothetical protein
MMLIVVVAILLCLAQPMVIDKEDPFPNITIFKVLAASYRLGIELEPATGEMKYSNIMFIPLLEQFLASFSEQRSFQNFLSYEDKKAFNRFTFELNSLREVILSYTYLSKVG